MTNITIPAGPIPTDGSDCVIVTATEDDILKGDEDFEIAITGTDFSGVTVGPSATVTVTDNDGRGYHKLCIAKHI